MMRRAWLLGRLFMAVAVASTSLSWGQTSTTSLRGIVSDPHGAVLRGASVTLSVPSTAFSRDTTSDGQGMYEFVQLPPSTYTLSVSASGFAKLKVENVRLLVNTPATLNVTMQVEGGTTTITVTSEASLINTTDATIGNPFGTEQIQALPFEGRDPTAILSLQPGVAFVSNNSSINLASDNRSGAVSGARSDQTNVTIDGLDDNDQTEGYAFSGALRATLDSLQEFRVTTTGSNADSGRSSGAQVTLVTKSGTNQFHGSLYEFNRNSLGEANDWFNKHAELGSGQPNVPGHLIRNTFGGSIGGPIKKERLFFFATYEGQRTRENTQVTRRVPSTDLRQGIIHYITCPTAPNCTPGDPSNSVVTLGPAQIAIMDPNCRSLGTCPLGRGVNPAVLAVMQGYPLPNTNQVGDGYNVKGFSFSAPAPAKLDTYIAKLDYNLTTNGNHRLFLRGNLQNDRVSGTGSNGPQFRNDPPNQVSLDNSKGLAGGYTAVLSNNLVNNLHYGYIRQGTALGGLSRQHHITFGMIDDPVGFSRSVAVNVPVHNLVDDVTWARGRHTIQLGVNFRMINDLRSSTQNSFYSAETNGGYYESTGIANKGVSFDPVVFGFPAVASFFGSSYDYPMTDLAGLITQVIGIYNRTKTGSVLPEGAPVRRHFRAHEGEFYVQDSLRVKPNLTFTGGVRYTLLQPPYETSGTQAAPDVSLNDFFRKRAAAMLVGQTFNPVISYDLSGQANGRKPYWEWDYKDVAPRIAFAWSPRVQEGWLRKLLGRERKTSIRGGYGIYYDHFGEGVVNTFDRNGSFGLTTLLTNPTNLTPDNAPRFTDLFAIPTKSPAPGGPQLLLPPPTGGFPATPPSTFATGGAAFTWGLDDKLKTPYSHVINFSIARELPHGFVFEASYVGRLAHRLLQDEDLATPLDIVDPKSGVSYFAAATQFSKMAKAGVPINAVNKIPYWEDIFPTAAGSAATKLTGCGAPGESALTTLTATQAMYDAYACNLHNEAEIPLFFADYTCFPGCATLGGVTQPNQFYSGQWASLYAWRSIGNSSYHAGQFILRHRSAGLQWDFNYTFSKSIDIGSNAERTSTAEGFGFFDQIINAWSPNQLRGPSDFDATHQINSNWVYDLPVGRGKRFGSGMRRLTDAFLGGWQFSGLFRWTSGFPYNISNATVFPTDWGLSGLAINVGKLPSTGFFIDSNGNPNIFKNKDTALNSFTFPLPGQSGQRNTLRGQGFFGIDTGISKTWKLHESQTIKLRWETFNVTNTPRFTYDASAFVAGAGEIDIPGTFGEYTLLLNKPRVMQFALRYSF